MMSEYVCMYWGLSLLRGDLWQEVDGLVEITFMHQTNWRMPWEGLKAKQIQMHHSAPFNSNCPWCWWRPANESHDGQPAVFQAIVLSKVKQYTIVTAEMIGSVFILLNN